jgi:hypothetical protein
MKKLFAAILALGLIIAVSGTASAADVKFGGSYYVAGVYDNNPSLKENSYSRAYFFQRIRLEPVFKIAEGLTFTARMDAMEQNWDVNRRGTSNYYVNGVSKTVNAGYVGKVALSDDSKNFDWERGYVDFATGIGQFTVGYISAAKWGTDFADSETTRPRIKLTKKLGPMILIAIYEKQTENNSLKLVDADKDAYYLAGIYPFKGGQAGVLYGYVVTNTGRPGTDLVWANVDTAADTTYGKAWSSQKLHLIEPMMKATFGPVYVEAEIDYFFGKAAEFERVEVPAGTVIAKPDLDFDSWAAYLMAKTNMGPATFGAQVGWAKGDKDPKDNKIENAIGGGGDWNPALILMNSDLDTWSGGDVNTSNSGKSNFLLFNIFGDYKVTPKFSMGAAFTYAKNDTKNWEAVKGGPLTINTYKEYVSDELGYELDVTATYKLYDNLTYMVGAGYLWTGDAFKKTDANAKVDNDYILMNKLTLSF